MRLARKQNFMVCLLLSLTGVVVSAPLQAQPARLRISEIAQIVDIVLDSLVAEQRSLSSVTVAKRGVILDHRGTLESFGYGSSSAVAPLDLRPRRRVNDGGRSLLGDCDQFGHGKCEQLGWSIFVWVEARTVSASDALVRVWVLWPERGTSFVEGVAPTGRAHKTGFTTEVYLTRDRDGNWRFVRKGRTILG
jgi:hypothetical protein